MDGSNNTFLGSNTGFKPGITYYSSSIALGAGATITSSNQLMVASNNVTAFNMAGLTPSTGTGAGTILEFDLAMCFPLQGPTRLSWPLTPPLPLSMALITFDSLTQLYQTPQRITSPLSHGEL